MQELLTTAPVPDYPRNLADTLGAWLQRLGFEVAREENYRLTHVEATWTDAQGQRFTVRYTHYHPAGQPHTALFSLYARAAGATGSGQCLISATHVRRAGEVRLMLLANHFYKQARQAALAAGTLQPA